MEQFFDIKTKRARLELVPNEADLMIGLTIEKLNSVDDEYACDYQCSIDMERPAARSLARRIDQLTLPLVERREGSDDWPEGDPRRYVNFAANGFSFASLEDPGHVTIKGMGSVPVWLAYAMSHCILQACVEREQQEEAGRLRRKTDG
jgi:hypothetical protein